MKQPDKFWNPYLAGILLGLVLLASYVIMAHGLGASGGAKRLGEFALEVVASDHVENMPYFAQGAAGGKHRLDNWLVFEILGVFLGGLISATLAGRFKPQVVRGPKASIRNRLILGFTGGVIMGVAARMARGCTSGQALSGGALFSVGGWVFMLAVFAGGYAMAYFVRRQWT